MCLLQSELGRGLGYNRHVVCYAAWRKMPDILWTASLLLLVIAGVQWCQGMSDTPMMKCGHAANARHKIEGGWEPSCVICLCYEIDDAPPELETRRARCSYYGKKSADGRYRSTNESNYGDSTPGVRCQCEEASGSGLPFFRQPYQRSQQRIQRRYRQMD
jgi:hypothetical protein